MHQAYILCVTNLYGRRGTINAVVDCLLFNLMNIVLIIKLNSATETNQFGIFNLQK